jgi:hypothetical protein
VLVALFFVVLLVGHGSPNGQYLDKGIAADGDPYWEFRNGKVSLVINTYRDPSFGTYGKAFGGWVWTNTHGKLPPSLVKLRFAWWGLKIGDSTNALFWPRRFLKSAPPN